MIENMENFGERFDDILRDHPDEFSALTAYMYKYMEDRRLCDITRTYIQILNMARIGGMMKKGDFQKNVYKLLQGFKQNLSIDFDFSEFEENEEIQEE